MKLNKKIIILATVTLLLLALGVYVYVQKKSDSLPQIIDQNQQEAETNSKDKQQFIEDTSSVPQNTPSGSTTTPSTTPSSQNNIELSARQESNNTVTVFTKLFGYSDGDCELVVTNGARTSSQKARIVYQPEFSSCAGFSVATSDLGKGRWTIKLIITSNNTSVNKSISLEIN